jgi:hypothetical protein
MILCALSIAVNLILELGNEKKKQHYSNMFIYNSVK